MDRDENVIGNPSRNDISEILHVSWSHTTKTTNENRKTKRHRVNTTNSVCEQCRIVLVQWTEIGLVDNFKTTGLRSHPTITSKPGTHSSTDLENIGWIIDNLTMTHKKEPILSCIRNLFDKNPHLVFVLAREVPTDAKEIPLVESFQDWSSLRFVFVTSTDPKFHHCTAVTLH